jgi:nicotinate-nucleotide adenylyltransferase
VTRIGVLGGTFDPPHYGHLMLAEQAREQLALSRVLWVPAGDPPHKQDELITPVEHRLALVHLAIAGNPKFELSLVDARREGPHYSYAMLAIIAAEHPGDEVVFLIGEDSLRDLPTWKNPEKLIEAARLGVMRRRDVAYDIDQLEAAIPGLAGCLSFIDTPMVDISSEMIRDHLSKGRSARYQTPDSVLRYIHQHRLYQNN